MESLWLSEHNFTLLHYREEPNLRYRVGKARRTLPGKAFGVVAIAKVSGGVRFSRNWVTDVPDSNAVLEMCLKGDFCPRPYSLAQDRDACSSACAFTLLNSYCTETGLDINEVTARGNPGQDWGGDHWLRVRSEAQWQGIECPGIWLPEHLTGLLLTLHKHWALGLMDSLLDAIGSGHRR